MGLNADFINVKVQVNGKTQTIKMERGTSFENKGGIFTAGETNGTLKMTNYQLKTFEAMANNYKENGENGIVLSKKDIELAKQMYKKGGFVNDISEFLPNNYKIEKPVLKSNENLLQVYVTNGKPSQSATLKFSFTNLLKKEDSTAAQMGTEASSVANEKIQDGTYIEKANGLNALEQKALQLFDIDRNGIFDKKEAKAFNASSFAQDEKGNLIVTHTSDTGKTTQVKVLEKEMDTAILSETVDPGSEDLTSSMRPQMQSTFDKYQGESISEKINKITNDYDISGLRAEITSVTVDKNGNTKYVFSASIIDPAEGVDPKVSDYIVFDKTGNIIESKQTKIGCWDNGCYEESYTISKDGKTSYYAPSGELKGVLEEQADGKIKHMDANGNCLYYTNYKEIKNNAKGIDEGHTYYYDPNGSLKYIVKHDFNDNYKFEHGFVQIEVYENGNVVKQSSGRNQSLGCHDPEYVVFEKLSDECIGGIYQISTSSY